MGKKLRILLANIAKMVQDTGGLAKVHCAFANEMAQRGILLRWDTATTGRGFFLSRS